MVVAHTSCMQKHLMGYRCRRWLVQAGRRRWWGLIEVLSLMYMLLYNLYKKIMCLQRRRDEKVVIKLA